MTIAVAAIQIYSGVDPQDCAADMDFAAVTAALAAVMAGAAA